MDILTQQQPGAVANSHTPHESALSAVSWAAIVAGALVAAASSLVLIELGSGLGLASLSAWPNIGASVTTFGVGTAIWLVVVQWLASALGGYLAGRLRTKWANLHTHEVFFRDTAHGFITWAVATLIVAAAVAFAGNAALNSGVHAAVAVTSDAAGSDMTAAADAARRAASQAAIFGALSMIIGAFIACVAAALGGRRRDLHA